MTGPSNVAMNIGELLGECRSRCALGESFEAIWNKLLQSHPLTLGAMTRPAYAGGMLRRVPLRSGGALVFDGDSREWSLSES